MNYKIVLNEEEIEILLKNIEKNQENKEICNKIIEKLKKSLEEGSFKYLDGLEDESKEYFFKIKDIYSIDLYHSLTSVINNNYFEDVEECFEYYKERFKIQRPEVFSNEKILKKIIKFVKEKMEIKMKRKEKTYEYQ